MAPLPRLKDPPRLALSFRNLAPRDLMAHEGRVIALMAHLREGVRYQYSPENIPLISLETHATVCVGAFLEDTLMGFGLVTFFRTATRWRADFEDIILDPSICGEGYGKALVEALQQVVADEVARAKRPILVQFTCASGRHRDVALGLFKKLAFEQVGEAKGEHGTNTFRKLIVPPFTLHTLD